MVEKIPIRDLPFQETFWDNTVSDLIGLETVAVDRWKRADEEQEDKDGEDDDRRKYDVLV